ncbi:carboxymuconolactone decarboxylase family protein [Amycolatopsis sp. NPDC059657]|uniref:carboxymuconolactone decarboxylase family protein n=1 Tax=Amycolatopsis sp. NPDC059657 TaxID=3346899 RepID=UPI00366E4544
MEARMKNPAMVLPDAMKGIQNLFKAMNSSTVSQTTMELVHLRASQINGCSACVYGGLASAKKAGETDERLGMVAVWRESPLFTDEERAALALAECATRLADRSSDAVSDELWDELTSHFDEGQISALILMVATTNLFNRINAVTKTPAGATW